MSALRCLSVLMLTATAAAVADPVPPAQLAERYRATAAKIIASAREGNQSYLKLQELCDDIGPRLSGSEGLEKAIRWAVARLTAEGHDAVRTEKVMVPKWTRGLERLELLAPRAARLPILTLGGSVGTPAEGLEGEVVVVADEFELKKLGDSVAGKIVLFNNPMPAYDPEKGAGYGKTVRYRVHGPRLAAAQGAIAVLVRSVTARSLRSPHTGGTSYQFARKRIPAAAVTTEDAALFARWQARGKRVRVRLTLGAKRHGRVESANVVAELKGSARPEEIVVVSGHLDSWDVGSGAHDDGAGSVMAMEALALLKRLGLRPRRTIRLVLWTNEENGLAGARQYVRDHAKAIKQHVAAIEADSGGYRPLGLGLDLARKHGGEAGLTRMQALIRLLAPLGATKTKMGYGGADIGMMKEDGVPLLGLMVDGRHYFDIHHTHADTVDKVDPKHLTDGSATLAVMAYVLADMPGRLGDPLPRAK